MPKINFEKVVRAERNKVFDIFANFENFQKIMPEYFPSVRVRSIRGNIAVVEEHIIISGKEFILMAKHLTKYPKHHEVFVIGGDAKGSHIIERYESINDITKITVEADFKISGFLKINALLDRDKVKKGFIKIFDEFARVAEK